MPASPTTARLIDFAHRLFWPGLAVYVFTLPISHSIAVRNAAFVLLILATLLLSLGLRQKPTLPLPGAWAAYAGIALISCLYAISPLKSLGEVRVEIFYCIVIFAIAATWAKNSDLLGAFALIAAASNLILVVIALSVTGFDKPWEYILTLPGWARAGLNANYLLTMAPFLGYTAWALWRQGKRPLAAGLALLLLLDVLAMMVSLNRQALLALAAGIFCAGALLLKGRFTWRRAVVFFGTLLLLAGLLAAQMIHRAATTGGAASVGQAAQTAVARDVRWSLWKFSLEKIGEHPLAGGGFGRAVFDKLYPDFMPEDILLWHAHNMVLNKGIQMGIPGMLAFLLLWYALLRAFTQHLRGAARERAMAIAGIATLATIFVKNMTDDFFVRDMALWFWLVAGVLLGSLQRQEAAAPALPAPR